jgi:actin cytoskeleton-regulatory complex protein PAN1
LGFDDHSELTSDSSDDDEDDRDTDTSDSQAEREAREHERQLVLDAAGLVVRQDAGPRPRKRRPPPAVPFRASVIFPESADKGLPPLPELDPVGRVDDAFERYENFRKAFGDASINHLSVASTTEMHPSPPLSPPVSLAPSGSRDSEGRGYSNLFYLFGRNKTPTAETERARTSLLISGPISNPNNLPHRESSPAFGSVSFQICGSCGSRAKSISSLGEAWWTRRLWRVYHLENVVVRR